MVATALVYASEDVFRMLPIHWMWWPAIGGVVIGVGGLFVPQALGVGYDVICAWSSPARSASAWWSASSS